VGHVRGALFLDYVKLIRATKSVDWSRYLEPEDFAYLREQIDDAAWYPMATFERMGLAILHAVAQSSVATVRYWGQHQADAMLRTQPDILEPGNPRETLMRVAVHRRGFFDYEVLTLREIGDGHALCWLAYRMSDVAELAACAQTAGALEALASRAGGADVTAVFAARTWEGDEETLLELDWS
jgi:hypothetical protein